MNLINHLAIFVFMILPSVGYAGSSQIDLDCISADSKSSIRGYIPGDSSDYDVSVSIRGDKSNHIYKCDGARCDTMIEKGSINVIVKPYDNIIVMQFYDDSKISKGLFYAIPKSIKIKDIRDGFTGSFSGFYEASTPDYDKKTGQFIPIKIKFSCKIKYQI